MTLRQRRGLILLLAERTWRNLRPRSRIKA
nr:MAG TPA: hypothetical protein [Caudoviricetes sp.]